MKTVKLITCDDAFQAHVIQGALKNEGIASVLHNENMSSVMRGYDSTGNHLHFEVMQGGVRVDPLSLVC